MKRSIMMRNILLLGVLGALIAGSVAQEITISGGSGLSAVQSALLIGAVQTNDTRVLNFTNAVTIGTLTVPGVITSTNAVNAPIKAVTGSSQTNLTFWTGSAASYAALASTNASTIYFITN